MIGVSGWVPADSCISKHPDRYQEDRAVSWEHKSILTLLSFVKQSSFINLFILYWSWRWNRNLQCWINLEEIWHTHQPLYNIWTLTTLTMRKSLNLSWPFSLPEYVAQFRSLNWRALAITPVSDYNNLFIGVLIFTKRSINPFFNLWLPWNSKY